VKKIIFEEAKIWVESKKKVKKQKIDFTEARVPREKKTKRKKD